MPKLPSIELLEATHVFPGPYVLKIIGQAEPTFVPRVLATVRDTLALPKEPPHSLREASGGRHVAVSLELEVQSAAQVHTVYERLLELSGVVLML